MFYIVLINKFVSYICVSGKKSYDKWHKESIDSVFDNNEKCNEFRDELKKLFVPTLSVGTRGSSPKTTLP